MKAIVLTINVIAVIATLFFLSSNFASAQTVITYPSGYSITVTENGWSSGVGNQGSLSIFEIDTDDISGINVSPVPPRIDYCSVSCQNGTYGVTVLDNDLTEQYNVNVSGYSDGEYVFATRDSNGAMEFDFAHSQWARNDVEFSFVKTFLYTVIVNGKIKEYSYEPRTVNPFNITSGNLYLQEEFINTFALRLYLFAPKGNTTASFTEPLSASVIQGVQDTGQNIWPLFVLAGIPLAFIIGLQLIVFTRRAVMLNSKK